MWHAPDPALLRLIGWILGFIALCSLVSFTHPGLRGPSKRATRQAINSWWAPALTGVVAVIFGRWATLAIFAGVSTWTLREYLSIQRAEDRQPWSNAAAYLAVPIHYAAVASGQLALFLGAFVVWAFAVVPVVRVAVGGNSPASGAARLQLGLVWTVLGLSHVAWLMGAGPLPGPVSNAGFTSVLLLAVMVNDAAQYVCGKLLGKRPLAPRLSPKKTWEGLFGGLAITTGVLACAAPSVTPLSALQGAAVGAGLAAVGTVGDLMVSAVKRELEVKDTGQVLPGQGGLLDRCDSLVFSAPLYAHLVIFCFT